MAMEYYLAQKEINLGSKIINLRTDRLVRKGKRTKRQRIPVMVSSTSSSSGGAAVSNATSDVENGESATDEREEEVQEENMAAKCLMLLAQGGNQLIKDVNPSIYYNYQCKTCNRCFHSFQALGGHRASHKKLLLKARDENDHDHHDAMISNTSTILSLEMATKNNRFVRSRNSKVHECLLCGAQFSSGQALGGHMRRHRTIMNRSMPTTATATTTMSVVGTSSTTTTPDDDGDDDGDHRTVEMLQLDLNLPAEPEQEDHRPHQRVKMEQAIHLSSNGGLSLLID